MGPKLKDLGGDESGKCIAISEAVGGRGRDRTGDPLLAKRATEFIKSCRSRRNPLKDDNV